MSGVLSTSFDYNCSRLHIRENCCSFFLTLTQRVLHDRHSKLCKQSEACCFVEQFRFLNKHWCGLNRRIAQLCTCHQFSVGQVQAESTNCFSLRWVNNQSVSFELSGNIGLRSGYHQGFSCFICKFRGITRKFIHVIACACNCDANQESICRRIL